jgi:hypothetical protein
MKYELHNIHKPIDLIVQERQKEIETLQAIQSSFPDAVFAHRYQNETHKGYFFSPSLKGHPDLKFKIKDTQRGWSYGYVLPHIELKHVHGTTTILTQHHQIDFFKWKRVSSTSWMRHAYWNEPDIKLLELGFSEEKCHHLCRKLAVSIAKYPLKSLNYDSLPKSLRDLLTFS